MERMYKINQADLIEQLIPMARWSILYGPIKKTEIATIPKDSALLFSWPLCKVFSKYLKACIFKNKQRKIFFLNKETKDLVSL
jgi:hypothetical protein